MFVQPVVYPPLGKLHPKAYFIFIRLMAQHHALSATLRRRSGSGALKAMRREGLVPAVIYGKSRENINIKVQAREFAALLKQSASEHILVDLDLEGTKHLAVLQDVQHDSLTGFYLHADFHAVAANERIHAVVPVEVTGEAAGIKLGGLVEILAHELHVTCLAEDLPESIVIDVTALGLGQSIHISDITLPAGVKFDNMDASLVVILVSEPKVAVEASSAPAEPEVLREKKPADSK